MTTVDWLPPPLGSPIRADVSAYFAGHAPAIDRGQRDVRLGLRWLAEHDLLGLGLTDARDAQLAPMGGLIAQIAEQCLSSAFALWCQRAGPWWIGDLLNAGEDRFGETFSQMCEGAVSAEMLNRYASVARRVPLENRRPGLSWSAHAVTARLPLDVQKRLLLEAERRGWTTDELRAKARAAEKSRGRE